jgi:hypothetical protein
MGCGEGASSKREPEACLDHHHKLSIGVWATAMGFSFYACSSICCPGSDLQPCHSAFSIAATRRESHPAKGTSPCLRTVIRNWMHQGKQVRSCCSVCRRQFSGLFEFCVAELGDTPIGEGVSLHGFRIRLDQGPAEDNRFMFPTDAVPERPDNAGSWTKRPGVSDVATCLCPP